MIEIAGAYLVLALYASIAVTLVRERARSRGASDGAPSIFLLLLFIGFTSYALGRGMHVAANGIHDMMAVTGGRDPWGLALFWDERAGHQFVDVARILFAVALCGLEPRRPDGTPGATTAHVSNDPPRGSGLLLVVGAVAYGFIYFATAVEGQTVFLALPFSAALATWAVRARRPSSAARSSFGPVTRFFVTAAVVSLLLFLFYGFWQGGFPEFTSVGIL
jgi:hypothetical protein